MHIVCAVGVPCTASAPWRRLGNWLIAASSCRSTEIFAVNAGARLRWLLDPTDASSEVPPPPAYATAVSAGLALDAAQRPTVDGLLACLRPLL